MTVYQFMHDCPLMAMVIILAIMIIANRFFRTINMYKNGYPPAHCDADGDLVTNKDEEDTL